MSNEQLEKSQEISFFDLLAPLAGLKVFKNHKVKFKVVSCAFSDTKPHYITKANRTGARISLDVTFHKK